MFGIVITALLAAAAVNLVRGERVVNDNASASEIALYAADQALSEFYANFTAQSNLGLPTVSWTDPDTSETDVEVAYGDYTGAHLLASDFSIAGTWVRVTPTKLVSSRNGDVYMLEAMSEVEDVRPGRPSALRRLRTYAELVAPLKIRAALSAPNGVTGIAAGSGRLTLNGNQKGGCGSGTSVPGLATPAGEYSLKNKKTDIKVSAGGIGHDTTTSSYTELRDSLGVDWALLTDTATYTSIPGAILIPGDYATLNAVPFGTLSSAGVWPVILVKGNVLLTTTVDGFGMLIVDGSVTVTNNQLKWRGMILTGKGLEIRDAPGKSHLHATGAVITGLSCTAAEISGGTCRTRLQGEHLGVTYAQCDVEAAWASLLTLRPLTPSRHSILY